MLGGLHPSPSIPPARRVAVVAFPVLQRACALIILSVGTTPPVCSGTSDVWEGHLASAWHAVHRGVRFGLLPGYLWGDEYYRYTLGASRAGVAFG